MICPNCGYDCEDCSDAESRYERLLEYVNDVEAENLSLNEELRKIRNTY